MLTKETLAALSMPFEDVVIKTKKGMYGDEIRYVPGYILVQRLNAILEGRWSFTVQSYEVIETEVIVMGTLEIDGITKQQYGSAVITKDNGAITSLATDIKSASMDSLKRCAAGFGILDSLYAPNTKSEGNQAGKTEQKASPNGGSSSNGSASPTGNGHVATNAQMRAITNLCRRHNVGTKE